MLFHASQTPEIRVLVPHLSEHGRPFVYFSTKRENVLVYLSNAVERYCHTVGYQPSGACKKWGSYGFTKDGILQLDEYYPNATMETYRGAAGYIYSADCETDAMQPGEIPFTVISEKPVAIDRCEFVPDAYDALKMAAGQGKVILTRYEDNSAEKLNWIKRSVVREYESSALHPEYRLFLKAKFHLI